MKEARSFRCLACGEVYADQLPGYGPYFHVCPFLRDGAGRLTRRPGHRDENIVQDIPGGPPRPREPGAGRALLAYSDVVTGEDVTGRAAVAAWAPIGPVPYPEDERPADPRRAQPAAAE